MLLVVNEYFKLLLLDKAVPILLTSSHKSIYIGILISVIVVFTVISLFITCELFLVQSVGINEISPVVIFPPPSALQLKPSPLVKVTLVLSSLFNAQDKYAYVPPVNSITKQATIKIVNTIFLFIISPIIYSITKHQINKYEKKN